MTESQQNRALAQLATGVFRGERLLSEKRITARLALMRPKAGTAEARLTFTLLLDCGAIEQTADGRYALAKTCTGIFAPPQQFGGPSLTTIAVNFSANLRDTGTV